MNDNDFETFTWRGQLRYKCCRFWESGAPCEYDTHDLENMRAHLMEPHSRSGKTRKPTTRVSPLVDAGGNPIITEEVSEEVPEEFQEVQFRKE